MIAALRMAVIAGCLALPAAADAPVTREIEGSFDDAVAAVENAIIGAGLTIEGRSHVGEMLARTRADVGGTKEIFRHAEVFTFCSARVSREVMERDPANIRFCPYAIFVYETPDAPGRIVVGHADHGAEGVPEIDALLDPIIDEAAAW